MGRDLTGISVSSAHYLLLLWSPSSAIECQLPREPSPPTVVINWKRHPTSNAMDWTQLVPTTTDFCVRRIESLVLSVVFGTTGRKRKLRLSTATNTNQEPERARRSKSKNITMDNTASKKAQDCSIVRFLSQAS